MSTLTAADDQPTLEGWEQAYAATPERDVPFTTLSSDPVAPLYTAADLPEDHDERLGAAGPVPVHARRVPVDVPRAAVDDAPVRRVRDRRGDQRAVPLPARSRPDRAVDRVRHAVADGPRLRPCRCRSGRSGARGSRSTPSRTWRRCSRVSRSDEVSVSMTINAPAAIMLAFYVVAGRAAGGRAGPARRDDPDRHPEGVHRAEGVVLPDRSGDAAGRRHDRVVLAADAALAPDQRSPVTTSARPGRPRRRSSRSR